MGCSELCLCYVMLLLLLLLLLCLWIYLKRSDSPPVDVLVSRECDGLAVGFVTFCVMWVNIPQLTLPDVQVGVCAIELLGLGPGSEEVEGITLERKPDVLSEFWKVNLLLLPV